MMQVSGQVIVHSPDHIFGGDHHHAFGNAQIRRDLNGLLADVAAVFLVAVTEQLAATFPATAVFAAGQRSHGRDALSKRIEITIRWTRATVIVRTAIANVVN